MQHATTHIKQVNQSVKMYYAINEEAIEQCEYDYLWREIKKLATRFSLKLPNVIVATRSLLEQPECSMAQQKLIQYANEFVDESTRLLDSLEND